MNTLNYIKGAIVFAIAFFTYSFGVSRTKNKELKKEKKRNDKTLDNIRKANKISDDNSKLSRDQLIDKL